MAYRDGNEGGAEMLCETQRKKNFLQFGEFLVFTCADILVRTG